MLFYAYGRLYYVPILSWLTAATLLAAPFVGYKLWLLRVGLNSEQVEALLGAADYGMAGTLMSGVLYYFISYNLVPDGRFELYLLRAASALLASAALLVLTVQLLSRPVLAASAALYAGASLNVSCWWTALMLRLQDGGLGELLPEPLHYVLLEMRPIDWLRSNSWTVLVTRLRQLVPVMLLPDDELHHAMELLPPEARERLLQRGLHAELPRLISQLVRPWAAGPDFLRVRRLSLSGLARQSSSPSTAAPQLGSGGGPATTSQVGAPEWLLLYALRRHVTRSLRRRIGPLLDPAPNRPAHLRAALALAVAIAAGRLLAGVGTARRRKLWYLMRRLAQFALPVVFALIVARSRIRKPARAAP